MPPTELLDFTVILTRPEHPEAMALAKALAGVRKTPVQDQVREAKNGWGIVAEHLSEPAARALSDGLTAGGFASAVVRSDSLTALPDVQALKTVEPGWTEGLLLVAAAGFNINTTTTHVEHQGPTASQKILSAGIMMATGLPIHVGPEKRDVKKEQTQSELVFYADLLYRDRRRRVDAQHFDYAFLKEGRLYQMLGNFKLLLAAAVKAAPLAWKNHGAQVLLENRPMVTMAYQSLADLERETRWLLTLRNLHLS